MRLFLFLFTLLFLSTPSHASLLLLCAYNHDVDVDSYVLSNTDEMSERHKTALGTSYFFVGVFPEKGRIVKAGSLAELEEKAKKDLELTDALKKAIDEVDAINKYSKRMIIMLKDSLATNCSSFTHYASL